MPEIVPAPLASLPEKPSDLDGWSAADLTNWIDTVAVAFAAVERRSQEVRLSIGLALWKLRDDLPEGDYGREVARVAELSGFSPATLGRWRAAAETHYGLGPPPRATKRVESRRSRELTSNDVSSAPVEASAQRVPNANLLVGLDPAPVASGPSTAPDPAPGGNGPRAAPPVDRPPSAELGEGSTSTPQEPPASSSGSPAPLPEPLAIVPEAPSPAELVAALLLLKPDRLAGVDGPSLRSLLALVRGALEAQAARSKPAAAPGAACPHPKAKRKSFGYVTICEACGQKV